MNYQMMAQGISFATYLNDDIIPVMVHCARVSSVPNPNPLMISFVFHVLVPVFDNYKQDSTSILFKWLTQH